MDSLIHRLPSNLQDSHNEAYCKNSRTKLRQKTVHTYIVLMPGQEKYNLSVNIMKTDWQQMLFLRKTERLMKKLNQVQCSALRIWPTEDIGLALSTITNDDDFRFQCLYLSSDYLSLCLKCCSLLNSKKSESHDVTTALATYPQKHDQPPHGRVIDHQQKVVRSVCSLIASNGIEVRGQREIMFRSKSN